MHSQIVVIKDNLPWEPDVNEILELHTHMLQGYLKRELEIERDRLLEKIFEKTLEQIFIENRLYKKTRKHLILRQNSFEQLKRVWSLSISNFLESLRMMTVKGS